MFSYIFGPKQSTMTASFPLCWCRVGGARSDDPGTNVDIVVPATARNPYNTVTSIQIGDADINNTSGNPLLPMYIGRLWAPGDNIKIGFLDGDDWQKSQVKSIAPEWTAYANLSFTFPNEKPFDILVSFDPKNANFSVIGVDSLYLSSRDKASMNLGSVQSNASKDVIRGIILHEFGHAIGATHVLETPISDIKWDKATVYKELAEGPLQWSQADVDARLFKAYPDQRTHDFGDRSSIMQYAFPDSWTTNKKGSPWNTRLSKADMDIMRLYYPYDFQYYSGQFQSMEVRHWNNPQALTEKVVGVLDDNKGSHRVISGVNCFDLDNEKNFRLKCSVTDVTPTSYTCKMESWGDTINYLSGMSYLELKEKYSFVQTGEFSTSDVRRWDDPKLENSKRVEFKTPFSGPTPKVICWITGLDFDKSANLRIKTYATDIDNKGFTIHVDSWSDSIMYLGNAQWLAVPGDRTDVKLGNFNSLDIRKWQDVKWDDTNLVKFDKPFTQRPKMFFALNWLDLTKDGTWCCRVAMEDIRADYFKWHLQSWWTTAMYSAGAAYFAYV